MIDQLFESYFGDGFNPPGIQFIVFSVISLILFRSFFIFLEQHKSLKICSGAVKLFSLIGRNSLYVFMYHLTIKDCMMKLISLITSDTLCIWVYRLLVFIPMLLIPVLIPCGLKRGIELIKSDIEKA